MMEVARGLSSHTTAASHRATDVAVIYPMERTVVYISLPICIFGLIGNSLLACNLCNKVRRTKFTVYLFHLAAADLIILICHVIMLVLFLKLMPATPHLFLKMELVHEIGFCISMYLLTAVSTERFLSLFFPLFYNRVRPLNFTIFVCIVLWGLATIMALVIHISCNVKSSSPRHEAVLSCESAIICYLIVHFVIFGPLLVFTTVGLYVRMRNLPKQTPVTKLDITIVATVFLFLILAASVKIVEILAYWIPKLHTSKFFACIPLIDSIQSSSKPFLYAFIGHSKNVKSRDRFHIFLERALMDERYIADIVEALEDK